MNVVDATSVAALTFLMLFFTSKMHKTTDWQLHLSKAMTAYVGLDNQQAETIARCLTVNRSLWLQWTLILSLTKWCLQSIYTASLSLITFFAFIVSTDFIFPPLSYI